MMNSHSIMPRIAIACGGTGGHLFPGMAVARQLVEWGSAVTLLVSPKDVDQRAVNGVRGLEIVTIPAVALQRGSGLAFLRGFARSYLAAHQLFKVRAPHAALAMGGFTSVPPVLVARRRGAKIFLHESNTVAGRANRMLARFADVAFLGFSVAARRLKIRQTMVTGTPVRSEFRSLDRAECCRSMGLDPARRVVLVMGGSQGASAVNELLIRSLPLVQQRAPEWQWLHLAGPNDAGKVRAAYARAGLAAVVHPFFERMELVLGAADAAVTRAGASSLAELAAMQVPPVLVPLPGAADNHQYCNARAFEQSGAARLLEQGTAAPEQLVGHLLALVLTGPQRTQTQTALLRWHSPNAAAEIAAHILASIPEQLRRGAVSVSTHAQNSGAARTALDAPVEVAA